MTDLLEIMSIYAYDIQKTTETIEEILRECGLERIKQEDGYVHTIQSQPSAK